jgi:hypothetical protein
MQHEKTWTIIEYRDGESNEVTTGASHAEALTAIRRHMYGGEDAVATASETSVHELPLAA